MHLETFWIMCGTYWLVSAMRMWSTGSIAQVWWAPVVLPIVRICLWLHQYRQDYVRLAITGTTVIAAWATLNMFLRIVVR
jgi:uncharacterized membrane protein